MERCANWRRPSPEQERSRLLRGLIKFTAEQISGLPAMKVGRPVKWQGTSLIVCPSQGHYWGATPVGTFSANGWDGFVVVWADGLARVVTERTR